MGIDYRLNVNGRVYVVPTSPDDPPGEVRMVREDATRPAGYYTLDEARQVLVFGELPPPPLDADARIRQAWGAE